MSLGGMTSASSLFSNSFSVTTSCKCALGFIMNCMENFNTILYTAKW
ncbi:hypothetical protein HanXRQr2_Chr05g0228121 [Helianthus annuus]|uniref:Uncharacterized protein n=1 Tax=Helianthus annuus TaxID=4232 RepID=A0A9K3J1E0_HELAN|nr:hypothetical protein HanXRQr2_Chr05g0228121 [Helianthus annuus]KAJ0923784.1 hypothetical protein HanPSC8_Chr05g0220121 [Helianthus annuus]